MSRRWRSVLTLAAAIALGACASPEATRQRAGGSGGDVGNRTEAVRMHEGSDPYYRTPCLIGMEGPPLDPLRHARQRARE